MELSEKEFSKKTVGRKAATHCHTPALVSASWGGDRYPGRPQDAGLGGEKASSIALVGMWKPGSSPLGKWN